MGFNSESDEWNDIALMVHQAALDPHLNEEALKQLCEASIYFNLAGFCTNLSFLSTARERLGGAKSTKLIAAIAFPFGMIPNSLKVSEAKWAAERGAEEFDLIPNFFALSQGKAEIFGEEIATICELGLPVRVILNIAQLSRTQLTMSIETAIDAGVIGVQTGNGFGRAVTQEDVRAISDLVRGRCSIKAVGGIKTLKQSTELIKAGATHIGTTMGAEIMQDLRLRDK